MKWSIWLLIFQFKDFLRRQNRFLAELESSSLDGSNLRFKKLLAAVESAVDGSNFVLLLRHPSNLLCLQLPEQIYEDVLSDEN